METFSSSESLADNQSTASSSVGFSYSYTRDQDMAGRKESKHRGNLGYFHIVNPKMSYGLVFNDITETKVHTRITTLGTQYALTNQVILLGDIGYNYSRSFSGTFFYRAAVQLKFYQDYILRAGYQDDKNLDVRGNSIGLSWLGPKFSLDISYNTLKARENLRTFLYGAEKITESSIAFTMKM